MRITNLDRARIFGAPGDRSQLITTVSPWGQKVVINSKIAHLFLAACSEATTVPWEPRRIDSLSVRPIRGTVTPQRPQGIPSLHGWGLAWDFFASDPGVPPPGGVWKPYNTVTPDFARCFTRRGFYWGAKFDRQDWPHIEWAAGLPPRDIVVPPVPTNAWEEEVLKSLKVLDWSQGGADLRHGLVDNVQGLLKAVQRKDCDPGDIDGIVGPQTRVALLNFRRLTGRPDWQHPVVDQDVWARLMSW